MPELFCAGVLFDLDGTLVDSIQAVNRAWTTLAKRHNLDPFEVLERIHGRRALDSLKLFLEDSVAEAESLWLREQEVLDTHGVCALPGAVELIASLPPDRWAIVTSGTSDVARARLKAAGIPEPRVTVFGEEVDRGKPAPDPYLLGAERLGLAAQHIVAFEDTHAGLESIRSAGMTAIAVGLNHNPMVYDYRGVVFKALDTGFKLELPTLVEPR
jgi:sugar-phosphatase